jgi:hypothetical protein
MRWKSYKELPVERFDRAEIHQNTLWLQSPPGMYEKSGRLFSIDIELKQIMEAIPHHGNIEDFCIQPGGTIYAMMSYEDADELWTCKKNEWDFVSKIRAYEEIPPGFDETKTRPRSRLYNIFVWKQEIIILSAASILRYSLEKKEWKKVKLSEGFMNTPHSSSAVITSSGMIYFGNKYGEFGGSLNRISVETGVITNLDWAARVGSEVELVNMMGETRKSQTLYQTLLTPVTGIIIDPSDPDKIIYSLGMQHMVSEHGGIFKLHETEKELVFGETAVYDMRSDGRSYFAATSISILEFREGKHRSIDYGNFRNIGGLLISTPAPGVAVVPTDINRSTSLCGLTPLLAVEKKN